MDYKELIKNDKVDFEGIEMSYFLIGLLSAFDNRFQALADKSMKEITWKQFFVIICTNMCKEPPTIKELAEIMGSSHQNVKQLLMKMEKKGFIQINPDPGDRRKQRVFLTEYCREFCEKNDESSSIIMEKLFEGLSPEQLRSTIETISRIEANLESISQ